MLIFKKEKEARTKVLDHLDVVRQCLVDARGVVEAYLAGDQEMALQKAAAVDESESRADEQLRGIRDALLDGAFLPNIRSDISRLVDAVDTIAGKAEDISRFVIQQSPEVPEEFRAGLLELYGQSNECFLELRKGLRDYFKPKGKLKDLHDHVERVSKIESGVDDQQSVLTEQLFGSSLGLSQKIHFQQMIKLVGNIADLSEDASDELGFAAMKSVM